MLNFTYNIISETCIEYIFGDTIDKKTSDMVLSIYNYLHRELDFKVLEINDIIPTYTSIAIHFTWKSPLFDKAEYLHSTIQATDISLKAKDIQSFEIEVNYNGEDMEYITKILGLSKESVIELHADKPYSIAMLGFRPYFPYLLGLDEKLTLARREKPRLHVKRGSVAIGAGQTGIYSEDSPGGWHIIGHTNFDNFEKLRPSDSIIFRAVKDTNAH